MGGTELNTGMCITASLKSLLPFHKILRIVVSQQMHSKAIKSICMFTPLNFLIFRKLQIKEKLPA